jgi:S-adenosylmethionine synthetase
MTIRNGLFTSESVSEGHPDKLADQISDAILDRFLTLDPQARVACETFIAAGFVVIAGEFKTRVPGVFALVESEAEAIARSVLHDAGYSDAETGIDPARCEVLVKFNAQSEDINQGVDQRGDQSGIIGAGDQGLMFGYATNETPECLPLTLVLAHRLVKRQAEARKSGLLPWLRPDAKSQVTVRYVDGKPLEVTAVVLSTQHAEDVSLEQVRSDVLQHIIQPVLAGHALAPDLQLHINPTGRFVVGGPKGDTGLTGRKIIVDTYGGAAPHGGGAFSGKDPSKVDRSAAYAARYLAKQVVARGWAERCLIQLSYAIGVAEPVSFLVDTDGTGIQDDAVTTSALLLEFDLKPKGIIAFLDLQRPIYRATATYGHFGREDIALPWETVAPWQGAIGLTSIVETDIETIIEIPHAITISEDVLIKHINVILFYLWDPIHMNYFFPRAAAAASIAADELDSNDDISVTKYDPDTPSRLELNAYDDEYINYAYYLACIVPEQASVQEIYDYLCDCEVNAMGLDGDKAITMDVAQRLYEIGQGIILAEQQ